MWQDDKIFQANDPNNLRELGGVASPAFRLSAQGSRSEAHPFDHVDVYARLFKVFEPLLRKHAERLTMTDPFSGKSRRRVSITKADWQPFEYIKQSFDDERNWIGFDFKSGKTAKLFDKGPTGFRFRLAKTAQLDATIPVAAFDSGELDLAELKDAMLALPMRSALAGYGMATSSFFDDYETPRPLLMPVARKFPAIDVCPSPMRSWFPDDDLDFRRSWVSGVNWLTLVRDPLLSEMGGAEKLMSELPPEITARSSDRAVLFQLGDRPITGEAGKDDAFLPLYHALGRKLSPLKDGGPSKEYPRFPVFGWPDESLLWERRFYDGKWFEETSP